MANMVNDEKNPFAGFAFDKLPTELLVDIFKHARADDVWDAYLENGLYPVALTHVCQSWRRVALGAPTLWANIHLWEYYTEEAETAVRTYVERSGTCPLFLTWFPRRTYDTQKVIDDLIVPYVERWQRITLIASDDETPRALLGAMKSLDFPILQDVEISCLYTRSPPSNSPLCRNAPLLRRCKLLCIPSLPPLGSNLTVLDCVFTTLDVMLDLDPFFEFLPHVAHSLQHLRFGPPVPGVSVTPRSSKIPLENLKSLLVMDSHVVMDHILTPNITHFAAIYTCEESGRKVSDVFDGFSAPNLRSIAFRMATLQVLFTSHDLPSAFPQLESVMFTDCVHESAFFSLLEPYKLKQPSSFGRRSGCPPTHGDVEVPFQKLRELVLSDTTDWTSLQAAIEKRLKNGNKSLRKIWLPEKGTVETIMRHVIKWLPKQGIEHTLYGPSESPLLGPPEFQDEFCVKETSVFNEIMERSIAELCDLDDDDDYDYWEDDFLERFDTPPNIYAAGLYEDFDDEDAEDEDGLEAAYEAYCVEEEEYEEGEDEDEDEDEEEEGGFQDD